jgi:sulfide dehydrogenase cytochrome subunit
VRLALLIAILAGITAVMLDSMEAKAAEPSGVAGCSGCHAISKTVDTPVPRLFGRKADELNTAMLEFKSGKRPNTVMTRLAKGFSDEEIVAMSAWFAAQKD